MSIALSVDYLFSVVFTPRYPEIFNYLRVISARASGVLR